LKGRKGIMKIKWKIVFEVVVILICTIIFTNVFFNKSITKLVNEETKEELTNYSLLGESIWDAKYPGDWSLDGGDLYKGDILINNNFEIVDKFTEDTGILATIFAGNMRVSTTVKDEKGNRQLGTPASDSVIATVITNDKSYQGNAVVAGSKAAAHYVPLHDKNGEVVGMWFVGVYTNVVKDKISASLVQIIGFQSLVFIIGCILAYILGNVVSNGFNRIKSYIVRMEEGDFQFSFHDKIINRKDEVGDITTAFLSMQRKISETMHAINNESIKIEDSTTILASSADIVYSDVEDISATTQQLSAGMEETAASTQEMNATAAEIEKEIESVAEKSNHGLVVAAEIKVRAEKLMEAAIDSQKTAVNLYDKANKKLRESIDKTSAINEIKTLSKTILSISAQTNLLALNASIESARAGEAGKGFAVVANQIRVLAENSKAAVSKIEHIINDVSGAVEDLVNDSTDILGFVDNKVIKDYEVLVQTGEQYHEDANTVEVMVAEIKNSTKQLLESVHYIRQAIDEVSTATNEGANGSSEIAQKSTSIAIKTSEVLEQANLNKEIASHLNDLVQFFKI